MKILSVFLLALLTVNVLATCTVSTCDSTSAAQEWRNGWNVGGNAEPLKRGMWKIMNHLMNPKRMLQSSESNCEAVLNLMASRVTSFASEYWHIQDSTFNNIRGYGLNDSVTLSLVTEMIDTYYDSDATFLLTISPFIPPVINTTGRDNLIAGFYAIRVINGGELRFNGGSILRCIDHLNYRVVRDTLAVTFPLDPATRQPLGYMNFILSTSEMDIVADHVGGDLKIQKVWSDQRGLYYLSNLTLPLTNIPQLWSPTQVQPLLYP